MDTLSEKILICLQLAEEYLAYLETNSINKLDFRFFSTESAGKFSNLIKTMVLCTVVRSLPDMVSVKIFE